MHRQSRIHFSLRSCATIAEFMKIALNARHLNPHLEGIGIVTDEVMRRMVASHPEDQFFYFFDQKILPRFQHGSNVTTKSFLPPTRLPFLIRYWLDHPVKKFMLKEKPNVFFSPDGFIPLGMSIPKVSMVHDVAFLRFPEHLPERNRKFYDVWMPRYLTYTNHIITVSEFSKKELISGYGIPAEKISVVYNGVTEDYTSVDDHVKHLMRKKFSHDLPYFLYLGAIHPRKNVLLLIEAFERFKAETNSPMQLVIAGRKSWHFETVVKACEESQCSAAIHLIGYVPTAEATQLVASAEAMIYPSLYEGFGLPIVEAMACEVPVICSNVSSLPEVAGEAALLFEPNDASQLALHMQSITESAVLRASLIEKGKQRAAFFSWDKASAEIYTILTSYARK